MPSQPNQRQPQPSSTWTHGGAASVAWGCSLGGTWGCSIGGMGVQHRRQGVAASEAGVAASEAA
eukprot:scaffold94683_cov42-Phaeocystis_antarctica.AAC.4